MAALIPYKGGVPTIRPFTGLLYDPDVAGRPDDLTAPPYDVISSSEREQYLKASPFNVVRLILGEGETEGAPPAERYRRAGDLLAAWRQRGVLKPTAHPALYPYEMEFVHQVKRRRIRGLIASVELEPWGGSILPHERTMPGAIQDRLMLLQAVRANLSPVYVTMPGPVPGLGQLLETAMVSPPETAIVDEEGTSHRLWQSTDIYLPASQALLGRQVMVADGHHRYEVALAYRDEMRRRHGPGPWDWMMMLLVDASSEEIPVLPFHRLLFGEPIPEQDGRPVAGLAELMALLDDAAPTAGELTIANNLVRHRLIDLAGPPPAVCALHDRVLDAVDPSRIGFAADAVLAEQMVATKQASAAYLLPPSSVGAVESALESRGTLPEKSTRFWPKPRTGLVIRPFDL